MKLEPGTILDDKYRIVRLIGEGAMGAVYEGENTLIKRSVAIKVLHADIKRREEHAKRFEREARAAGQIGSDHIVSVIDFGDLPDGHTFMVMEYLEGEDLGDRIERCGKLDPEELFPLILQLLAGIHEAHLAGIIHRDLKPENVFITRRQDEEFVKILDFGVSKFRPLDISSAVTQAGQLVGTPHFMSPEQARGRPLDPRADVYAVGAVMFTALAGTVPFEARSFNDLIFRIVMESPRNLEELVEGIDPDVVAIVRRAMARDRNDRYADALELARAVGGWLGRRDIAVPSWVPAAAGEGSSPADAPGSVPPSAALPLEAAVAVGAPSDLSEAPEHERDSSAPPTTTSSAPPPASPPRSQPAVAQPRRGAIAITAALGLLAAAMVAWLASGDASPSASETEAVPTSQTGTTSASPTAAPDDEVAGGDAAMVTSSVAETDEGSATSATGDPSAPPPSALPPLPTTAPPAASGVADAPPASDDTPAATAGPEDGLAGDPPQPVDAQPDDAPASDAPPSDTAEPVAPPAGTTSGRRVYEQL